jgi:hypothetical protein
LRQICARLVFFVCLLVSTAHAQSSAPPLVPDSDSSQHGNSSRNSFSYPSEPEALPKEDSLEQRQPLELVFADSIVPQDLHEMMLTTGGWYSRHGDLHDTLLTQKVEWGLSDKLQVSTFVNAVHGSNAAGTNAVGIGDFEIGARYTWAAVGSRFTHIAVAFDAGFPTGDPPKGLGEAAWTLAPSVLLSRELRRGKYQVFSTTGVEFVVDHRQIVSPLDGIPHHAFFSNSGMTRRIGHGWGVAEISFRANRWSGGDETQAIITPTYVWRIARRAELLLGIPLGITSSTNAIGGVIKFTFELGGTQE